VYLLQWRLKRHISDSRVAKPLEGEMPDVLMETDLKGIKFLRRGKVRDIYELRDYLLIIATDRVSAFTGSIR